MRKTEPKPLPMDRIWKLFELSETSPSGLRWRIRRKGTKGKGAPAGALARTKGNPNRDRYFVGINGATFRAHRIIYAMHHGLIPEKCKLTTSTVTQLTTGLRISGSQHPSRTTAIGGLRPTIKAEFAAYAGAAQNENGKRIS